MRPTRPRRARVPLAPTGPIGLRHSLRILGLGTIRPRASGRAVDPALARPAWRRRLRLLATLLAAAIVAAGAGLRKR